MPAGNRLAATAGPAGQRRRRAGRAGGARAPAGPAGRALSGVPATGPALHRPADAPQRGAAASQAVQEPPSPRPARSLLLGAQRGAAGGPPHKLHVMWRRESPAARGGQGHSREARSCGTPRADACVYACKSRAERTRPDAILPRSMDSTGAGPTHPRPLMTFRGPDRRSWQPCRIHGRPRWRQAGPCARSARCVPASPVASPALWAWERQWHALQHSMHAASGGGQGHPRGCCPPPVRRRWTVAGSTTVGGPSGPAAVGRLTPSRQAGCRL